MANADRQRYINHVAEYVGAGTGTAYLHGVPGVDSRISHRAGLRGAYRAGYGGPFGGVHGRVHGGFYDGIHKGIYSIDKEAGYTGK